MQLQKEFDPIVSSYFLALQAARHSLQAFIAASRLLLLLYYILLKAVQNSKLPF